MRKSTQDAFRQALNEQFQPVKKEVAALVTAFRELDQNYNHIGQAVSKIESTIRSWDKIIKVLEVLVIQPKAVKKAKRKSTKPSKVRTKSKR